jgi:hypothetical protein
VPPGAGIGVGYGHVQLQIKTATVPAIILLEHQPLVVGGLSTLLGLAALQLRTKRYQNAFTAQAPLVSGLSHDTTPTIVLV